MPTAKRVKRSGRQAAAPAAAPVDTEIERPTPADVEQEEHPFVHVARQNWLKAGKKGGTVKVKNDLIKGSLWDVVEKDSFSHKPIALLESLQTLESYLWPGYTEQSSNFHVLLIVLIVNAKRREQLATWSTFTFFFNVVFFFTR